MRARYVWAVVGLVLFALVLGLGGFSLWVRDYLKSRDFRLLIEAKAGDALDSQVTIQPQQWSGSNVFTDTFSAVGNPDSPVERIEGSQIRAAINWRAMFDGVWAVRRIDVAHLEAAFRPITEHKKPAVRIEPIEPLPPPKRSFFPDRFQLDLVSVANSNLRVGNIAQANGVALEIRPEGDGWLIDGRNGHLSFSDNASGGYQIEDFRLRLQSEVLYVTEARLRQGEAGEIQASGQFGGDSAPYSIRLDWNNMKSDDLLGPTWRERLTGRVSGEATVVGRPGQSDLTTGRFLLQDGMLKGFPVQKSIADFTRSPQFERMPLHEVSGEFVTDGVVTDVKKFVAESKGLFKVEGDCRIAEGGKLTGKFQVGITPQTLQWLPGSRERVFTESRGGYLWTDLTLSGTVDQPNEDLSGRLKAAAVQETVETGVELIEQAPERAREAAEEAIDILSPLIR